MFTITAHQNPYLRAGQNTMQAVLSLGVAADGSLVPAPLALGIALDRSGSMDGSKINAARAGAIKVVGALDETMAFMVVAFNDSARIIYGPAMGTWDNKQRAIQALQTVYAGNGTCMSSALNAVVDKFGADTTRAKKILFLTDGKNEGERRAALDAAVRRCATSDISITAWGVGTDWDADELRHLAEATGGSADIIPTPQRVEATFAAAFNEMRKTALTDTVLHLWTPNGVIIRNVQQVYPTIVPLSTSLNPGDAHLRSLRFGALAGGEQRDYLIDLEIPVSQPGQQFLMVRPHVTYTMSGRPQEEKSDRNGWIFAQWTENTAQAAQLDSHVAHYTNQEMLADNIRAGQEALARGDNERATHLLGQALVLSESSGNRQMTDLLHGIVVRDGNGTVRLNAHADAVARKTLAINVGHTSRLK
jgi:hypothetical protein